MRRLFVLIPFLLTCSSFAAAQDTDTERQAAREVLQKMATLEQSLDVPAMVARLTGDNAARDQVVNARRS